MAWEDPELPDDEDAVTDAILTNMRDRLPGWEPVEGAPEVALAEEIGRETAATNALTKTTLGLAFAAVGQTVYQLPAQAAVKAVLPDVELTFVPTSPGPAGLADSTIPAGFTIVVDGVAFELLADVTPTDTDPLHVEMTAVEPGSHGNIDVPTPVEAEILTATLTVTAATVQESGIGGVDEETLDQYLTRLVDYVSLLRPGGVRAEDLAAFARTVTGVHRAVAIDLYDPADESTDNERTATVIAIDADGQPVTSTDLQDALESVREVNFVIHLAEPTYTSVDIAVTVTADPGADPGALDADVTAAVAALIDPASWGSTPQDPDSWTERTELRVFDVAGVVFDVPGVASVETITLNGGTSTITLDGPAALPTPMDDPTDPSTVSVTVS